jgi:hypothetical protein
LTLQEDEAARFYRSLPRPVLILSSRAGRGNTSIGEAIHEYFGDAPDVYHRSIEELLPESAVDEDLTRYRFISNHFPILLSAIYTLPFFYYRKLVREQMRPTRLPAFKGFAVRRGIASVVCVSHRQAFWTTVLKRNESLDLAVYGVLTEFGSNLGWRYVFWEAMNGFVSPVEASGLRIDLPPDLPCYQLPLPARAAFHALPAADDPKGHCLVIGGFWGQGLMLHTVRALVAGFPGVQFHVVCGDNPKLAARLLCELRQARNLSVHGRLDSIVPLLSRCGAVVTKPGMGTLLEAHASRRKIFLFPGLPVAEDNNARYALDHFGAEWFTPASFRRWLELGPDEPVG